MVVDIISTYDDAYKKSLKDLRKRVILALAEHEDPKKIISFLSKCCILGIDEEKQTIYMGVPNDFVLQQVKKFFSKQLTTVAKQIYNSQYVMEFMVYPELQHNNHILQIDIKHILPTTTNKEKRTASISLDEKTTNTLTSYFGILFQKIYRFENFVVGGSNQFAHSVAEAIASSPGTAYNPFFMYGGVGLGKTHLMQALGNALIEKFPEKVIVYLPTSKFIDHIIGAIRKNQLNRLTEKLEEVDVLMLDDIQFLAGKEKTQEIFHNIFNDFTSKQKQIVVTSDQPPNKLTLLESRLQSRFSLGIVADIKPPDFETRVAILETKLKNKGETLDDEFVSLIADRVTTNVRELEGALNIVLTKKQLLKQDITREDMESALATLGVSQEVSHDVTASPTTHKQNFEEIIDQVSSFYGIKKSDLFTSNRSKEISFVRQLLMYVAKQNYHRSLQKIGDYFGGRNHASVIYAIRTFEQFMKNNHVQAQQIKENFLH